MGGGAHRGLAFSEEKEGQPLFWTLWKQKSLAGRINLFYLIKEILTENVINNITYVNMRVVFSRDVHFQPVSLCFKLC